MLASQRSAKRLRPRAWRGRAALRLTSTTASSLRGDGPARPVHQRGQARRRRRRRRSRCGGRRRPSPQPAPWCGLVGWRHCVRRGTSP
ncbi:hypothetical protein G5V59_27545 [Nocardioides sp. W3-2-3]|uniref:hypothetical protein n=1 Tax=Nocardioides convexus TaxID=2712224 RepID=UPI00241881E3|nr:hypothetical protein [Nocardioides convexus]NHA02136.1 hypothetical protein [Nocardioides convexus]